MAFEAGAAAAKIGLDISDYTRGMLQAQSLAQLFPATITNFIANPLLGLVGIAKQAGAALVDLFKGSTDAADNMAEMAANIGVSVEALSGLTLVAGTAGASAGAVADSFKFLGRNMAEAASGNKTAAAAFADLGVGITDAQGKLRPMEATMMDVADALAKLPEGGERSKAAMDLLGRGGVEMVGTLSQGSKAIQTQIERFKAYGAVVTEETARSSGKWNDMTAELSYAWIGFQNLIAQPMRDTLMPYLTGLLQWVQQNPQKIREIAKQVADAVVQGFEAIIKAGQMLLPVVKFVADHLGTVGFAAAALVAVTVAGSLAQSLTAMVGAFGAAGNAALAASVKFQAANAASRGMAGGLGKAGAGAAVGGAAFGDVGGMLGGAAGWLGGAKLGGAIGAFAGPVGAVVGGLVGGVVGGLGGGYLGSTIQEGIQGTPPINVQNVNVVVHPDAAESNRQLGEKIAGPVHQAVRSAEQAKSQSLRERIFLGL